MKPIHKTTRVLALSAMALAGLALPVLAGTIPAQLPAPDGKPGDATKPVKVYILAGQSNMVGMGELSGAKNLYTGIYLSSDPAVPVGPLQIDKVGNYHIEPLTISLPDGTETDQAIAQGRLGVPEKGVYQVRCGSGTNSYNTMEIDGKKVYHRQAGAEPVMQDVTLDPGKSYAFKISGFEGTPPRFWMRKTDLLGNGDLESVAKRDGNFPWLLDKEGNWTVRNDVYFQEARIAKEGSGSPLSATSNGKSIGPELGFGHVLGTFHDEQVLLIKTAMGNRALGFDFRPPSSGRNDPSSEYESREYKLMIDGVHKTLDQIDKVVPGYQGQGYEIAGFFWWQGHKDATPEATAEYEKNLTNLINDVRKEFKVPKMPVVVATVGFGGHHMADKYVKLLEAQMAVGDPKKHPEFAGTVASVDTRDFWREIHESPTSQDYHYNRNAETYMRVGDALGRAMVGLLGGQAESLPQPARPKQQVAQAEPAEPSKEAKAAARAALTPILLDGIAPSYAANPKIVKALMSDATGERPQRTSQFLQGALDGLVSCYNTAGVHDYDWHVFAPDLRDLKWDYFSFDPQDALPKDKRGRYRKVSYPDGMANWFASDFDAAKAGWKSGLPPFGQLDGKLEPLGSCVRGTDCGCGEKPKTLWEKEVLLLRGTFEIPALMDGHRYRLMVGGGNHVNAGEGYAIYVNGKLLAESSRGVDKREGGRARGGHIYADFRDEFKGGKVTIAVTGFLQYNTPRGPIPPQGHISVWMEEQKIPPIKVAVIAGR